MQNNNQTQNIETPLILPPVLEDPFLNIHLCRECNKTFEYKTWLADEICCECYQAVEKLMPQTYAEAEVNVINENNYKDIVKQLKNFPKPEIAGVLISKEIYEEIKPNGFLQTSLFN